jgi:VWFA-related protein
VKLAVAVLTVLLGGLTAQQPTFKSTTSLVEVDIIARDKDGRFVSGLTSDDFEVFEEGKPQTVQHFYLVTERASVTIEPRSDVVLPRSPDRTDRRIFIFFLDSEHLSAQALLRLKASAMDFVNVQLRGTDVAGVYVNGALVNGHLTNQRQELLDAIRGAEPAFETTESRMRALMDFPRVESLLEAAQIDGGDRLVLADAGTRACGGEQARLCAEEGGREFVEDKLQRKAHLFLDQSRRAASITMQSIGYVVRNLSGLEGRKTLVLLSEGFYANDARSTLPVLAGQAARAGVTIYAIDARGRSARSGVSAAADPSVQGAGLSGFGDTNDEALDVLSAETGGMTVRNRDDFGRALADVATDTSTYYVLAYSPENSVLDGKYRRIVLKAKWAGLNVRARRGYVASPLPATKQLRITK